MDSNEMFKIRPVIYNPNLLNHLFNDFNELFKKEEVAVPYDIVAHYNENNEVDSIQIIWALAGYNKDLISISVTGDKLEVNVSKDKDLNEDNSFKYWHKGIAKRNFKSTFTLLASVQKDKLSSTFKDGLLIVTLPFKTGEVIKINVE